MVDFQAINQGRVYALRYELCDDLPKEKDITDNDPRRTMWNTYSPIALFVSAQDFLTKRNDLVPVAIQMDYTPGSAYLRIHSQFIPSAQHMNSTEEARFSYSSVVKPLFAVADRTGIINPPITTLFENVCAFVAGKLNDFPESKKKMKHQQNENRNSKIINK